MTVQEGFPFVVEAGDIASVERLQWLERVKPELDERLLRDGAVLFRGIGADSVDMFESLSRVFFDTSADYVGGDSPRTRLSGGVYTSTEYAAPYAIPLHNELSYAATWPAQLLFGCLLPAAEGGETPVADSRLILRRMDPAAAEELTRRGVRYVRNLHGGSGFGRSWQQTFETADRSEVERRCAEGSMDFQWMPDGGIRLVQQGPGVATHPRTGDAVWFNQAHMYHYSAHPKPVYDSLVQLYGDDPSDLPTHATFADGGAISVELLESIRRTISSLTVMFPWGRGDVLWIDNMLTSHGRMPYRGERRIVLAMA